MFIRAVHKSQKKKIKASDKPTYEFLIKELVRCFGESIKSAEIGYYDEDQEFIRITNDEDLEICVEETQLKNKSKDVITVEIHVIPGDENSETISKADINTSFAEASMLETTKSDIQDWRVIDKQASSTEVSMVQEPVPEVIESEPVQEPSIFEEPSMIEKEEGDQSMSSDTQFTRYTNNTADDVVMDMKFTGTLEELEKMKQTVIHQFAPHAGFEVDKCEILTKRDQPTQVEIDDNDSILDNQSQMSHMSTQMKDEIETLIEEKLKRLSIFRESDNSFAKKPEPVKKSAGYFHMGVTCDNCMEEITGARFKSIVKKDYDLCETCESKDIHTEPMLKIRKPVGFRKGIKLNSHFEFLAGLLQDEPIVFEKAVKTCKPTTQDKIEMIAKAEQSLKESVKKATKMDTEPLPVRPRHTLCHIRPANPKIFEEKQEEKKIASPVLIAKPIDLPVANPLVSTMSKMFPHIDATEISNYIKRNEGLTFEEIINRFMDQL